MTVASSRVSNVIHDNFETFSLVWLDTQVNTTENNRQTQQELRQIINHLKIFDNLYQCYHYIMSLSGQDRLILIVSGQLGRKLVPQIHHLRQLSSIYVFCMHKQANERWTRQFTKVKNVIVKTEVLLHQMRVDHQPRAKLEEPLSIKIYHGNKNPDQSTTELNGHCVHSLLLIDVLMRIKPTENDKQEFIKLCKDIYKNNPVQLVFVHEFEREYTPSKALWWYTRESFVYKMINKALRIQNIDLLYLLRFLIRDIYQLLQQNQCQSSIRVYRGQVISTDELQTLQRSIDQYISISAFFSTSTNRQKALQFLDSSNISNDLHSVLFIINADPHVVKSKPFANISRFSDIDNESEVLFMTGCVFCLKKIYQNDDNIWIIQMELCDDDDQHNLKKLFNYMKKEYGRGENEVNLQSFGDVLYRMGKYDLAEKIYNHLLSELSPNDPAFSHLCYSFGLISKDRNEYDLSLDWFYKSLEIKMLTDPFDYTYIGGLYDCIGNVQLKKGNDDEAMQCYNKAMEWYNRMPIENHQQLMPAVYHGIGAVYVFRKDYLEALMFYTRALNLQEQYLPSNHSDMAFTLDSIGTVYRHLGKYVHAMNYNNQSLKMRQNSLPPQHQDIAKSLRSFGLLYEAMKQWEQAFSYYQEANIIYRHSLSPVHSDAIELQKDIQRISSHIK